MRKTAIFIVIITLIFGMFMINGKVYAANESIIDSNTESKLIEIKDNAAKTLDDYKAKYGSDAYGIAAYVLNIIRIYSIPFCFLGIAISAIYQYVIGIRQLEARDKGFNSMIAIVTLFVICQVLPLVFAIVVKGWRE